MDGILYVAKGKEYLDLACQSASTVKNIHPNLAIDVCTDETVVSSLFDQIRPIPVGANPKIASLPGSRFDRTLYLDCDTLLVNELGDLFDVLEKFPLAFAHDVRRSSKLIREDGQFATPYAFPQVNGGVILYRNSAEVQEFFASWSAQYSRLGRLRDQVSLKDVLWNAAIRFYILPPEFNLRRVTVLDAWEPLDARPTIIHSHRLLQHLRNGEPRITSLEEILAAERVALIDEWRCVLDVAQDVSDEDVVSMFNAASDIENECRVLAKAESVLPSPVTREVSDATG